MGGDQNNRGNASGLVEKLDKKKRIRGFRAKRPGHSEQSVRRKIMVEMDERRK